MAISNIILQKPFAILQQSAGLVDFASADGTINNATIVNIHELSDKFSVGDVVAYVVDKTIPVSNNGQNYLMIDEQYLFLTQQAAP